MEWTAFRQQYLAASERFVLGDPTDVVALYATDEPMHICGAFGGYESGVGAVRDRVRWAGEQFSDGTFTEELISEWVGANSAVTFAIETIEARIANRSEPVVQVLRVTQAYRRDAQDWRIAHRHADFLRPTSNDLRPPSDHAPT